MDRTQVRLVGGWRGIDIPDGSWNPSTYTWQP